MRDGQLELMEFAEIDFLVFKIPTPIFNQLAKGTLLPRFFSNNLNFYKACLSVFVWGPN